MRIRQDQSGQVFIVAALLTVVLLAGMALAVDVGLLFRARRNIQIAADVAATAGAQNLNFGLSASTAAQAATAMNGVTNGIGGAVVTVYSPPNDGPNTGCTTCVEVVVSEPNPTFFAGLITGTNSVTVSARAVGGTSAGKGCVYALNTTGQAIDDTASGDISLPSCGILDNSSSNTSNNEALVNTGSGTITASSVLVVGGYSESHPGTISPTPITGSVPVSDPLAGLAAPTFNSAACLSDPHVNSTTTIGPASPTSTICYNGLTISAGSGTVTLNPGIYVINGKLSFTGSAAVTGTGVTFYLPSNGDQISMTESGPVTLSAPTSGTYNGILFYQDRNDTTSVTISASGSSTFKGIIYAKKANLSLSGSAGTNFYSSVVVGSITFTGSLNMQDYALVNSGEPLRSPLLIE